ncbi:hypothetical protein HMPREF9372_3331 [Sporosarcina newyorkensis 2681]|uniref:Uncharacterized protein n=1 Tax=Sporosarcina newyorkensis 2681 TaxID=1027292 RepID=F9DX00_9BACL|nr:hypothetical protein [Sporosarcina newyorkensis]EGQ21294.1 hypothetical protein HMPREF9372_3331 [Sporosarcina newyorkensis 2681]
MNRKTKTISFNLVSEYDSRLLEFAEREERGSFSKYIKRLIDNDMRGGNRQIAESQIITDQVQREPEIQADDSDAMSGFL